MAHHDQRSTRRPVLSTPLSPAIQGWLDRVNSAKLLWIRFNMIFLLPDQMLSMVGGSNIGTDLGKETEGKVHGLFLQTGRAANAMGSSAAAAKATADKLKKDQAGAGNGQANRDAPGRSI